MRLRCLLLSSSRYRISEEIWLQNSRLYLGLTVPDPKLGESFLFRVEVEGISPLFGPAASRGFWRKSVRSRSVSSNFVLVWHH